MLTQKASHSKEQMAQTASRTFESEDPRAQERTRAQQTSSFPGGKGLVEALAVKPEWGPEH